jgi:hypothetical protein
MEDIISLTPKQVKGLVWHLNEELYRQQVHGGNDSRIITERLVELCVNYYNNTNIASSFEEQEKEQHELELAQRSPSLHGVYNLLKENEVTLIDNTEDFANGLKWSDKDYGKAFKNS